MKLNYNKMNGLVPAIIQDSKTNKVLMLGFMNAQAYEKTIETKQVTFFSRTKNQLWTKGETSGNYLIVKDIKSDCDNDTLLIKVEPEGNTCHLGTYSCFNENMDKIDFLFYLEKLIKNRKQQLPENSYTTSLFKKGINKIAQKVGEEAIELIIEAKDENSELFINEASDLLFHLMILLVEKNFSLYDIIKTLEDRHK
jgi:phosphoribosyl-AMP cyclohydrolase / phosphoribosyl-ATP pyrophosphohydrolase